MNDAEKQRVAYLQAHEHRSPAEDNERHHLLIRLAQAMNESHDPIHARVGYLESLQEPTPSEKDELWYKKNLLDHTMRCALGSLCKEKLWLPCPQLQQGLAAQKRIVITNRWGLHTQGRGGARAPAAAGRPSAG